MAANLDALVEELKQSSPFSKPLNWSRNSKKSGAFLPLLRWRLPPLLALRPPLPLRTRLKRRPSSMSSSRPRSQEN